MVRPSIVAKWMQMEFHQEMYNNFKPTTDRIGDVKMLNRKMKIYKQLSPVKTTSQHLNVYFLDAVSRKALASVTVLSINIDPLSRRPIPYPDRWKNHFTPSKCVPTVSIENRMAPANQKQYKIPDNAVIFTLASKITAKQINHNGHATAGEYFNSCLDCIGAAFLQSIFGDFGSVFDYKLKRLSILWLGELLVLQEIRTVCWRDEENPFLFKFHILNHNGVAGQVEFEFFPNKRMNSRLQNC